MKTGEKRQEEFAAHGCAETARLCPVLPARVLPSAPGLRQRRAGRRSRVPQDPFAAAARAALPGALPGPALRSSLPRLLTSFSGFRQVTHGAEPARAV